MFNVCRIFFFMMKGFNNIDKKKYENYYKKYLDLTTSKHKKGNYSKKRSK